MKENIFFRGLGLVVILGAIALTAFLIFQNAKPVKASVDFEFSGYNSTSTRTYTGTLTNLSVLKASSGILGSVVITGAGAGEINLYDATTTNSSLRTKVATTTLVTIPASTAAGTYTLDVQFNSGLIIEMTGTRATSTVTWK